MTHIDGVNCHGSQIARPGFLGHADSVHCPVHLEGGDRRTADVAHTDNNRNGVARKHNLALLRFDHGDKVQIVLFGIELIAADHGGGLTGEACDILRHAVQGRAAETGVGSQLQTGHFGAEELRCHRDRGVVVRLVGPILQRGADHTVQRGNTAGRTVKVVVVGGDGRQVTVGVDRVVIAVYQIID